MFRCTLLNLTSAVWKVVVVVQGRYGNCEREELLAPLMENVQIRCDAFRIGVCERDIQGLERCGEVREKIRIGGWAAEAKIKEAREDREHGWDVWWRMRMRQVTTARGFTVAQSEGWALRVFDEKICPAGM